MLQIQSRSVITCNIALFFTQNHSNGHITHIIHLYLALTGELGCVYAEYLFLWMYYMRDFINHLFLLFSPTGTGIYPGHYNDIIMSAMSSQLTNIKNVRSTVYSGTDQSKHQSSAPLAFVRGIYRSPVNSPHKWPITRKMFPSNDVIMGFITMPRTVDSTIRGSKEGVAILSHA